MSPDTSIPAGQYFATLQAMEPVSRKEVPDSPSYIYQIKWDGVRIFALVEGQRVILKNRKNKERTAQFPEMQRLAELVKANSVVIDGEMIVLDGGKPSFARVLQRDLCCREGAARELQRQIPCTYCLFDLLYLDGADLAGSPIEERQRLLEKVVGIAPPLYLNENFRDGKALYREVEQAGMEGIVAKRKGSPYRSGQKSTDWLKIKPRRRRLCIVGGMTMAEGVVGALLLGAYRGSELLYIGKAGSGLKGDDLLQLREYGLRERAAAPFFSNPPRGREYLWLAPRLTAVVEFAEWTGALRLRAPVVIGFSSRPPAEALL